MREIGKMTNSMGMEHSLMKKYQNCKVPYSIKIGPTFNSFGPSTKDSLIWMTRRVKENGTFLMGRFSKEILKMILLMERVFSVELMEAGSEASGKIINLSDFIEGYRYTLISSYYK